MSVSAERRRPGQLSYFAGLDGLRAVAVVGVLLYHGGVHWANGGFLGVEVFFVLSGFLITTLLVNEWRRTGTVALGTFWARRARRLLPALFCMVAAVGIYYAVAGPMDAIPDLKGEGISTLLYAGNWHEISTGASYFAATGPTSPLKHTWSLAIEEQFYLFWPVLLVGVFWLVRQVRRRRGQSARSLEILLAVTVIGTVASAVDMALLYKGGSGLDRVYYGTDTRAGSLLAGAALALTLAILQQRSERTADPRPDRDQRRLLGLAAMAGLLGIVAAMHFANSSSVWLYPYGLLAVDAGVGLLIVAVVLFPGATVGRILSARPIRAIGQISYGIYLWHFPLFLWLDAATTGLNGPWLLLFRIGVTLAVSVVSFALIEQPIRKRRIPTPIVRSLAPVAAGGAVVALLVASTIGATAYDAVAAPTPPHSTDKFTGTNPGCSVTLQDTKQYGLAPLPRKDATKDIYAWLGAHQLGWNGSTTTTFHTCPPKKVLVVGDSLAFTIGVGLMDDEEHYGVEVANAGILGCAFNTSGELDVGGTWQAQSAGCPNALAQWSQNEAQLGANAVVIELGYRDQFDWNIDGRVVHLGQPDFDQHVRQQIQQYVDVLGRGGSTKVLFLSVPYTRPPSNPDGSPSAAADPARHQLINQMLHDAARGRPNVRVLDIDKVVSPSGAYQTKVNGQVCRFDGIHFSTYCSKLLQPKVLAATRKLIAH